MGTQTVLSFCCGSANIFHYKSHFPEDFLRLLWYFSHFKTNSGQFAITFIPDSPGCRIAV